MNEPKLSRAAEQAALQQVLGLLVRRALQLEHLVDLVERQGALLAELLPAARPFLGLGATEAFRLAAVEDPETWRRVVQLGSEVAAAIAALGPADGPREVAAVTTVRRALGRLGLAREGA
jgi:hypothetical protein